MMTSEKLKKDAEKSLGKRLGTYAYIRRDDCYINYVDGYIDGAEPREKQIAEAKSLLIGFVSKMKNTVNTLYEKDLIERAERFLKETRSL